MASTMLDENGAYIYDPALRELNRVRALCEDKGIDTDIAQGIDKAIQLFKDRESYCETMTSQQSEALAAIDKESMTQPFEELFKSGKTNRPLESNMTSGGFEGQFLQSVISMSKAKRVLEIGMFTGYGALTCAEVLPPDGEVITCEFEPYLEDIARKLFDNSPHGEKIKIRIGPANETLQDLSSTNQQFDVVFIDADKGGYLEYYQIIMENDLLAKGGTILFDNSLYFGFPYIKDLDSSVVPDNGRSRNVLGIQALNEHLKSQDHMHKVMVPLRDGVLMVRRREDMFGKAQKTV